MKLKRMLKDSKSNIFNSMVKGVCLSYAITAIIFIIYAILITYTEMTEKNIQTVSLITTVISVIFAGFTTSSSADNKGWLWGMMAGFLYAVIMILIGLCLSPGISFSSKTVMIIIISLSGGGFGGILGINLKRK